MFGDTEALDLTLIQQIAQYKLETSEGLVVSSALAPSDKHSTRT